MVLIFEVIVSVLNIREEPFIASEKLTVVEYGDKLRCTGVMKPSKTHIWMQLENEGWFALHRVNTTGRVISNSVSALFKEYVADAPTEATPYIPTSEELYRDGQLSWNQVNVGNQENWLIEVHVVHEVNNDIVNVSIFANKEGLQSAEIRTS